MLCYIGVMTEILSKTKSFFSKLSKDDTYLVAVSGGVDSVVLAHLVDQFGFKFRIAHVDHDVRHDSKDDAIFVGKMAERYGVPFHCAKIESKVNRSFEEFARNFRYNFFNSLCSQYKLSGIFLGHHANDQAETIFNNFIRGTGVLGLSGMLPIDEKKIRPFLDIKKEAIIQYAYKNKLSWREDSTNVENDYDRNWIRNTVFPELSKRRNVKKVLCKNSKYFLQLYDYVKQQANDWLGHNLLNNTISYDALNDLHPALRSEVIVQLWTILYHNRHQFKSNLIDEVLKWLTKPKEHSMIPFGKRYVLKFTENNIHILLTEQL